MAASRLDMFWAEATDVNAATESPTKSARESLFAYLMNSAPSVTSISRRALYFGLSRFMSTRLTWHAAIRACLPKTKSGKPHTFIRRNIAGPGSGKEPSVRSQGADTEEIDHE